MEGAEILWGDDRPSNDRNEARMLRGFGTLITYACTIEEAIRALTVGAGALPAFPRDSFRCKPRHPASDSEAGLKRCHRVCGRRGSSNP